MVSSPSPAIELDYECEWDTPDNPSFHQWTTVNVAEVIPGVALPLNATWFQAIEKPQMRKFVAAFGASDLVPVYEEPFPNFIGFFAGRPALNMGFVMTLLSTYQVDAGSTAAEQFFTPNEGETYAIPAAADPNRALQNRRRTFRVWGQLERSVAADRAKALGRRLETLPLQEVSPEAIWFNLNRISLECSSMGANHLLASYAGSEYSSLLIAYLAENLPDVPPDAAVRLTSALDVESSRASIAVWRLSRWLRGDAALQAAFASWPLAVIDSYLRDSPEKPWREFARRFDQLLAEHGFHGRNEISLTVPDWAEDHTFLLNSLRAMVGAPDGSDPLKQHRAAVNARRTLEDEYRRRLPPGKRREYEHLLNRAQTFVKMRETTKTTLIRALRPGRPLLLELAGRLVRRGDLSDPEDLYFLLYHEIEAGLMGEFAGDVAETVARRRKQYDRLQAFRLPVNFVGIPTVCPVRIERDAGVATSAGVLRGLPVSGGRASGRARVIADLADADTMPFTAGDVLVAPLTDAPWTPLFLTAAAVVVETGGLLSHAATVAREFGIPAVAMVQDATRIVRDGQPLIVDGNTGEVFLDAVQ